MHDPVLPDDLERELARIAELAAGDVAGVFGPESVVWRVDREAAVFLGAGRALLLQLAHPWVAAGIAEHSRTLSDPIARFHRTFDVMFTLVFGSLDQALAAARRLHRRHSVVQGSLPEPTGRYAAGARYHANDAAALRWVHATLVDTALLAHDLMLPPLTSAERERYYGETRQLGAMFGLRDEEIPPDWAAFSSYRDGMLHSDELAVGPTARYIADKVLAGAGSWLRAPGWYRTVTAHLLPPAIREGFGLPYGERERRSAERAVRWLRSVYPVLPTRLRHVGPYHEAMARLIGRTQPDLLTQALNRLWIGHRTMQPKRRSGPG